VIATAYLPILNKKMGALKSSIKKIEKGKYIKMEFTSIYNSTNNIFSMLHFPSERKRVSKRDVSQHYQRPSRKL
jgi:hypothetical protein